jgi:hypothetical protein
VFAQEHQFGTIPPTKAQQRDAASGSKNDINMPVDFSRALSRVILANRTLRTAGTVLTPTHERTSEELIKYLNERLQQIGRVVEKARRHLTTKEPANATEVQKRALDEAEHCSRIVTAAEWMFDATSGSGSAMNYVQLAIAFEALYGGTKEDRVVETLSNRLVYGLARSGSERSYLNRRFTKFYTKRNSIVHHGATRLLPDEVELFAWAAVTLKNALAHEMQLASAQ